MALSSVWCADVASHLRQDDLEQSQKPLVAVDAVMAFQIYGPSLLRLGLFFSHGTALADRLRLHQAAFSPASSTDTAQSGGHTNIVRDFE
jgi:hypothetical protein